MMSLGVQATLLLGILHAVTAVPQQASGLFPGNQNFQQTPANFANNLQQQQERLQQIAQQQQERLQQNVQQLQETVRQNQQQIQGIASQHAGQGVCQDKNNQCPELARTGRLNCMDQNTKVFCPLTCGLCAGQSVCSDISPKCQELDRSRILDCQNFEHKHQCQLTCGVCGSKGSRGDVAFPGEGKTPNNINDRTNGVSNNSPPPVQQNQPGWTTAVNACIAANNDQTLERIRNMDDCKAHCQKEVMCKSVEYNTKSQRCILSAASQSHKNYQQPCQGDINWLYSETIETGDRTLQNTSPPQNQQSSRPSTAQPQKNSGNQGNSATSGGQQSVPTNQQNGVSQGNAATSGGQQSRPSNTNTNHQVQSQSSTGASGAAPSGRKSVCTQDPNPGECRGAFPRFYFNKKTDQCDCFLYGGCGDEAIESSWLTLSECHANCIPNNKEEGPRCKQLPKQDIQVFTDASVCRDDLTNCENSRDQCNIYPAFRKGCARTCGLCTDAVAVSQAPDTSNINDQELISNLEGQIRNSNN